jgi:hypothetical protein
MIATRARKQQQTQSGEAECDGYNAYQIALLLEGIAQALTKGQPKPGQQ